MIRVLLPKKGMSSLTSSNAALPPLHSAKRYLPLDHIDQEGHIKLSQHLSLAGNHAFKHGTKAGGKPVEPLGQCDIDPIKDKTALTTPFVSQSQLTSFALSEGRYLLELKFFYGTYFILGI